MHLELYGKKIWVYRAPIDFRKSIDGLSYLVSTEIKHCPKDGIYLFFNRGKDKIKCLSWHKNGFILLYKRLEMGRFQMNFNHKSGIVETNVTELGWLLAGLDWQKMRDWKTLDFEKFS